MGPTKASSIVSDAAKAALKKAPPVPQAKDDRKFGLRFLQQKDTVTLVSGTAAVTDWTTVDCSPNVPTDCTGVYLEVTVRNTSAPTGDRVLQVRREQGYAEYTVGRTRGTTTSDITAQASAPMVELSAARTFDYKTSAMSDYAIRLIGYYY